MSIFYVSYSLHLRGPSSPWLTHMTNWMNNMPLPIQCISRLSFTNKAWTSSQTRFKTVNLHNAIYALFNAINALFSKVSLWMQESSSTFYKRHQKTSQCTELIHPLKQFSLKHWFVLKYRALLLQPRKSMRSARAAAMGLIRRRELPSLFLKNEIP